LSAIKPTSELMRAFYGRLLASVGRAEALCGV
jgi:hypothetical protein